MRHLCPTPRSGLGARPVDAGNTLVIVISNDGAQMIFSDDGDIPAHRLSGDWRGQKSDLWDGGHCEPFVAVWPGQPLDAPI